ncbi:ARPP-2 domain-containing protein [Nonomuraea longicatena]|uniref:ARG and Rhodanese-Phosphatase-superfamily-associated domain-containing protein n=1 Tax=Nonomuraea longicatena TaxID=83682 RepID=A0ABP4AHP0_9ACTN
MRRLDLTGLTTRPAQVWGGIRLVPLVRERPVEDLRLAAELYTADLGVVRVNARTAYVSYIPHGFVADWTNDGSPAAAYGTHLRGTAGPHAAPARVQMSSHRRLARRVDRNRLRFLPLHLALEGYLALHFGGPEIAWAEWSRRAIDRGLSPRAEQAYTGTAVEGLQDALRIFEIHDGQCGVLVYASDTLAAAFAVPHPDDYRTLHPTLLHDLYGELIYHHANYGGPVPDFLARIADAAVHSLADLREQARSQQEEWATFHDTAMADGLLSADYTFEHVHRLGDYRLSRFLPPFDRRRDNHIGEVITGPDGRLAYLKTFRLSDKQVRRGRLLTELAAHDWNLARAAAALGLTEAALGLRIEAAGFGHLLRQDVLDRYRARRR